MLGIVAVVSLVLGAFVVGGGAFDWEFLFSDGYREHNWVRSLGREGARGTLILLGAVLAIVGFIGQVVDTASKPVDLTATTAENGTIENPGEPSLSNSTPATGSASNALGNQMPTKTPPVAGPSLGTMNAPPPSYLPAASGSSTGVSRPGPQPMTIWDPEAVDEDGETFVTLQYRFERGHQPLSNSRYLWIIDSLVTTIEVEYDPQSLQKQGQLTHLIRLPLASSGLLQSWSTVVMVEIGKQRRQVSNHLQIAPGNAVRSTPLAAQ
jgi:hypothetical protein